MSLILKGIDITDDIDFVEITTYSMGMPQKTIGKDIDQVIQIPKGHGKIVDLDDLVVKYWDGNYMEIDNEAYDNAPTILEAEE